VERLRLGIFEGWRITEPTPSMGLGGFGVLWMPCPNSTGRTVSCGPPAPFVGGCPVIMRMGIRCLLRGMSPLS
jgi:hypothetical protein